MYWVMTDDAENLSSSHEAAQTLVKVLREGSQA
jgi:hypothetical protein